MWELQGDYGYGHGYELLTASDCRDELRAEMAIYRKESPEGTYRIVRAKD